MLGEVLVVLFAQCGEREAVGEAAGGDSHVVGGARVTTLDGSRRQPPPGPGDLRFAAEFYDLGELVPRS